jgi:hypothetical protein
VAEDFRSGGGDRKDGDAGLAHVAGVLSRRLGLTAGFEVRVGACGQLPFIPWRQGRLLDGVILELAATIGAAWPKA